MNTFLADQVATKNSIIIGASDKTRTSVVHDLAERNGVQIYATDRPTTPLPDFAQVQKIAYDERYAYFDRADVRESCVLRAPHYSIFL